MGNKFKNRIIVGLTGQSGAGKSTVSHIFKRHGFFVINADEVARSITSQPSTAKMLSQHFGEGILNDDGGLNRKALAQIVFSNKDEFNKLNSLLFPAICQEIERLINKCKRRYVLLDAPQLFESGCDNLCSFIVSVIAPHDNLIERIMKRDGVEKEDAEKRLASQLSAQFFKEHSAYVIVNDSTIEILQKV